MGKLSIVGMFIGAFVFGFGVKVILSYGLTMPIFIDGVATITGGLFLVVIGYKQLITMLRARYGHL
jgi:uncharacterized membrane protein